MKLFSYLFLVYYSVALLAVVSETFILHYSESHHNAKHSLGDGTTGRMVCHCKGRKTTERLSGSDIDDIFESMQNHNFCAGDTRTRICKLMTECSDCTAEIEHCKSLTDGTYDCVKKSIEMRDRYFTNKNGRKGSHSLMKREVYDGEKFVCIYPTDLKTANLYIRKNYTELVITEKCFLGYTLKEGISRQLRCRFDEDKWTTPRFEECKPFIDCTLNLKSAGKLSCDPASVSHGSLCNVTCDHFEDKPEMPAEVYECTPDGEWKPELPFCVRQGAGLNLVAAPKVRYHSTNLETKFGNSTATPSSQEPKRKNI